MIKRLNKHLVIRVDLIFLRWTMFINVAESFLEFFF